MISSVDLMAWAAAFFDALRAWLSGLFSVSAPPVFAPAVERR